jgi:hypothetical protein
MQFTYTVKCETCSHTLREEHRLRMSKNMVQREIGYLGVGGSDRILEKTAH